ncbi:CPBP family intramembrane glutamic endopeptidase [Gracilibacillus dipsosauri]|uniref:CPBP family intramembrane glutamic endopeptidase n=1 Tax=Gracilibacillus dipsosauri TaxID=178340 RepID=UPI0024097D34
MNDTPLFPNSTARSVLSMILFATLLIFLQLHNYLLMIVWGIGVGYSLINKKMRPFIATTLTFAIGFFLYSYVNSLWIAEINAQEIRIIFNRLSLLVLLLPFIVLSLIDRQRFMYGWLKPQWTEVVRIPFIWYGFRQTTVSVFLVVAMIMNFLMFLPFIVLHSEKLVQGIWGFLLLFSILNALLEEMIWRGILLYRFSTFFGNQWAVWITSIGFGLQHYSLGFSWWGCLLFSIGGYFFGAITVQSKSILPAVIWHMLFNAMMVLSGMILD